ncbi:MAG: TolC family protein [Spirochaetes bacterium]|nr:TolC family protein [Spirochaetota bacterium]
MNYQNKKKFIHTFIITVVVFNIVVLLCGTTYIVAQPLTLQQAIKLAIESNNTYKAALLKVEENRYKVRESWGMLWPQLSTDVAYTRQWYESGFQSQIAGQYDVKIISGQIAINPGAFYNSLQASRNGYIASEYEARSIKANTIITTLRLYYQILLTKELITMHQEALKALEENLRVVTVGYQKGTFSKLDFLRAKVAYNNEKTQLINARNDYLTVCASFNIQLNRDINEPVELDESVLQVSNEDLQYLSLEEQQEIALIKELVGLSLKNRPELLQLSHSKKALEYASDAASSVYLWPSLFVSGNYGSSKSISKENGGFTPTGNPAIDPILQAMSQAMSESFAPKGWNDHWMITFGATYQWGALSPINSSHAKAKQLESQANQLDLQLQDFVKSVRLDIQRGFLKLKSASNSLYSQQGNVETAQESLKTATLQFRNGIIDNSKFLEANVALIQAKTLYIQALYDYKVSQAELNKAIGVDYFKIY